VIARGKSPSFILIEALHRHFGAAPEDGIAADQLEKAAGITRQ
jgi:hypothetical protein